MEKRENNIVTIVIPCLNERQTIVRAVQKAQRSARGIFGEAFEIIVADNNSTDGSIELVKKIPAVRIIHVDIRGYGATLHNGILAAKYPYVFFADADLSYDFGQLSKFLPFMNDGYDLILGSRFKHKMSSGAMPFLNRYVGTPVLTLLIRLIYGIKTSDCNSGMRAIKRSFYKKLPMRNSGMEWASELLIRTVLAGGRYAEVPITFQKDRRGKRTHLRRWEDGWRHLKVIILLKPILLLYFAFFFMGLTAVSFWNFPSLSPPMFLIAQFFIFTYLAAKYLDTAITGVENHVTRFLYRLPLVLVALVVTTLGVVQLFLLPIQYTHIKYILLFQAILFDLWLFFIETIKTHLIYSLSSHHK